MSGAAARTGIFNKIKIKNYRIIREGYVGF